MDNAKGILILLVVFGHFLEFAIKGNPLADTLYRIIYLFHIPAFVFVSGYFSYGSLATPKSRQRLLRLAMLYLLFQSLYLLQQVWATGEFSVVDALLYPYWLMWFIVSLCSWELLLHFFAKVGVASMGLALAAGVAAGYWMEDGALLSLERTFVFFPFFLAGFYVSKQRMTFHISLPVKTLLAILSLGVIVQFTVGLHGLDVGWLYGRPSFAELGCGGWQAGGLRLLLYVFSSILTATFFFILPSQSTPFSFLGRATLPIYLGHGLVLKLLSQFGFMSRCGIANSILEMAALSVLLAVTTASSYLWPTIPILFLSRIKRLFGSNMHCF